MVERKQHIPVVCFVGPSGSGKTSLLVKVIGELKRRGYRVGAVKHADNFDIDYPGKDSYRLRKAGAEEIVISSQRRLAEIEELQEEYSLGEIVQRFSSVDIVVVEGFKESAHPKIEVSEGAHFADSEPALLATVSDEGGDFDRDNYQGVADLLEKHFLKPTYRISVKEQDAKERTVISGCRVCTPSAIIERAIIIIENGVIADITSGLDNDIPETSQVVNGSGLTAVPGFIDIHMHGGGGADLTDGNPESISKAARFHARGGTTSFLASTLAKPEEETWQSVARLVQYRENQTHDGARMLGVHLEGPYVNPSKKGTFLPEYLRDPNPDEYEPLFTEFGEAIKMVTLAPELPGADRLIVFLREGGIVPAMGHTDATYEQAMRGIDIGITHATHLFNTMRGLHHREPGGVGAVLAAGISAELIADGYHVHPAVMKLAVSLKGPEKMVLITDAMSAAGLPDGSYSLGGQVVDVNEGLPRIRATGARAGSTLTMNRAFKNAVQMLGVSLLDAVHMASTLPATVLGIDTYKGGIEVGKDADIVLLNSDLDVLMTIREGNIIFKEDGSK